MKKIVTFVCVLCMSAALMAQTENDSVQIKGIHPYKLEQNNKIAMEHANWSIIPYAGVNWFFGDFSGGEYRSCFYYPTVGLGLEYSFNPVWSLGLEFDWARYRMLGSEPDKGVNADTLLLGNVLLPQLYLGADLANFFYPYGKKKIFSLIMQLGAGASLHKNSVQFNASDRNITGSATPEAMDKFHFSPFIKFGLNFEFNLNRTLALGVRASYNLILDDKTDNRIVGPNTDGLMDIALNMRFKLAAVSKTHARNVAGRDFPDQRLITASEAEGFIRDATGNLVRVSSDEAKQEAPLYVHDTVIIYRDTVYRETAAPATNVERYVFPSQMYYIYFASGKADIDEEGLITIQQIADRMAQDTAIYAVITAYCDNTGSNSVNYALGDKRASNVLAELRNEYDVPADHMFSTGVGKIVGRQSTAAYAPNRRVAVNLVDKETFDRMSADLEKKRSERVEDQPSAQARNVSLTENRAARVEQYAKRPNQKVTVGKSTTLAGLARTHYGNTHCWVYIYMANKGKLANPNSVEQGMVLQVPELTEEELQTTKEQCLKLYGSVR